MQLTKGSSHYNNVSNKPAEMANIKHNWNKCRNSRAEILILQISWSAAETAYYPSWGGGRAAN